MKRNSFSLLFVILSFSLAAQDLSVRWLDEGPWFATSDDSFGQRLPGECDDLHTYGLAFGWNYGESSIMGAWDMLTYRGTAEDPDAARRADRLTLSWWPGWEFAWGPLRLRNQALASLWLEGHLLGHFVQTTFHKTFSYLRPVPGLETYDPYRLGAVLGDRAGLWLEGGGFTLGLEGALYGELPLNLFGEAALRAGYQSSDAAFLLGLGWQSPQAVPGPYTSDIIRNLAAGLWLEGFLRDGPLFYRFANQLADPADSMGDGVAGYVWRRGRDAARAEDGRSRHRADSPWASMDLGFVMMRLLAGEAVEENLYFRLRFAPEFLKLGMLTAEIRNGGFYNSETIDVMVRNWSCSAGWEYGFELPAIGGMRLSPVLGAAALFDAVRLQDDPPYRSTTYADFANLGLLFRAAMRLALVKAPEPGSVELGLELALPCLSFGQGAAFPEAQRATEPRFGLILGFTSD